MRALLFVVCLLVGDAPCAEWPVQTEQGIEVKLRIQVPEQGAGAGLGRALIELTATGPREFETGSPRLEDALAGWRVARAFSSRAEGDATEQTITLELEQVKPGVIPLPGVRLPVRAGSEARWEDLSWPEPLHEPRDVAPPIEVPAPPPPVWLRRLLLAAAFLGGLGVAVLGVRLLQRPVRRPLLPHQAALAELEESALPPAEKPDRRLEHLADVVRRFTEQHTGVPATRLTTGELTTALAAEGGADGVPPLLARCDEVKFAGLAPSSEEVAEWLDCGREVIRRMAEREPAGEEGPSGEKRVQGEER